MRIRLTAALSLPALALAMTACGTEEPNGAGEEQDPPAEQNDDQTEDDDSQADSTEPEVPAGMTWVETAHVGLAVPEEFEAIDAPTDSIWQHIYQDGEATAQVTISEQLEGYTARMATDVYIDVIGGAVDGFRPVAPEDFPDWQQDDGDVDLNEFHRSRFTYDGYEVVLWSIADSDREAVLVQYVSSAFDEDVAQSIEQSLDLAETAPADDADEA